MRSVSSCRWFVLGLVLLGCAGCSSAEDASIPLGEPVLEAPTLHCLGAYWVIRGDENRNARVELRFRKAGSADWRLGLPLFRVEKEALRGSRGGTAFAVPSDAWLFAGSALLLEPGTAYELRLNLIDPEGGEAERLLACRTLAEPVRPPDLTPLYVMPGKGGGSGTAQDPFRGLAAAQARAQPGSLMLLGVGVYEGTFEVTKSGEPGHPIVWTARGDGEVILDAQGKAPEVPARAVSASDVHDVWFERLTIRRAQWGLVAHGSSRVVIRRCRFEAVKNGITATRNDGDTLRGLFISDNTLEGPLNWPRPANAGDIEEDRGIQVSGVGHVVCYNRVRNFKDAIDTFPSQRCEAIDFHNNEISECVDDGIEMDESYRNTRCFLNRLTNVFQGISTQPVVGGPVYIFRNALYNVTVEPFKMHNSPSGALMLHNTCVKSGMPVMVATSATVRNCVWRNNLFLGTDAAYAAEFTSPMAGCDFDYDGFARIRSGNLLKWNRVRYATLEEVQARSPVEKHAVLVRADQAFASGLQVPGDPAGRADPESVDLRLRPGCEAVDAGEVLPGLNDGYAGKAPDLGAYELGGDLPHFGPRPEEAAK
ncbi:right-handed parallel beta-helix repeat-containing protein [bacterium]|nr:right-handed parallel beta-helix repeat-containing protein [bacterium]